MTTENFTLIDDAVERALESVADVPGFADVLPHLEPVIRGALLAAFRTSDPECEFELGRLGELRGLRATIDHAIDLHVQLCHRFLGLSWVAIGEQLGMSRQGARQRYGVDDSPRSQELERVDAEVGLVRAQFIADEARLRARTASGELTKDAFDAEFSGLLNQSFARLQELDEERRQLVEEALNSFDPDAVETVPRSGVGR